MMLRQYASVWNFSCPTAKLPARIRARAAVRPRAAVATGARRRGSAATIGSGRPIRCWGKAGRPDQARLDYTRRLFEELGFAPKEAEARSFLLYAYIFCQGVFTFSDEAALQARIHALCCELIAAEEEIAS